jgi:uncharacterized membrane-anchored protein YjiN (DUF445 family)
VTAWLSSRDTAAAAANLAASALPYFLRMFETHGLRDFVVRSLQDELGALDPQPFVARFLLALGESGEPDLLIDRFVPFAKTWIAENTTEIHKMVRRRSRWWVPDEVSQRVTSTIAGALQDLLTSLQQRDGKTRAKLKDDLMRLVATLFQSAEFRSEINQSFNRVLGHPEVRTWFRSVWDQVEERALDKSRVQRRLAEILNVLGASLAADAEVRRQIDALVRELAIQLVDWRTEISAFIADVVQRWDDETLTRRVEIVVGSDLQYIRMNGTLVGACVGCTLFLAVRVFQ